jgi:hypothetical protein
MEECEHLAKNEETNRFMGDEEDFSRINTIERD